MTEREAIERLELLFSDSTNEDYPLTEEFGEAVSVAIKALEKQIPKKPQKYFEKFSGVWCSCGKYLGKGYFVDKPSFCPDCGQKLDWSDEE